LWGALAGDPVLRDDRQKSKCKSGLRRVVSYERVSLEQEQATAKVRTSKSQYGDPSSAAKTRPQAQDDGEKQATTKAKARSRSFTAFRMTMMMAMTIWRTIFKM
jgi:hypothetical protein